MWEWEKQLRGAGGGAREAGREHREGENGERKRREQRRPSDVPRAARGPVSLGPGLGGKQELSVGPWSPFPAPSQGYVNPLKTPLPLDLEALSSSLSGVCSVPGRTSVPF